MNNAGSMHVHMELVLCEYIAEYIICFTQIKTIIDVLMCNRFILLTYSWFSFRNTLRLCKTNCLPNNILMRLKFVDLFLNHLNYIYLKE